MASHRSPPATRSKGATKRGTKRKAAASLVSKPNELVSADVDSEHSRDNTDEWSDLGKSNLDEWCVKPDEPLSLPCGPTVAVPADVKRKIWRGEYISLACFLEETKIKQPYNYHPCSVGKGPESRRRQLADIYEWTDAFIEFMAIYVAGGDEFASRTPALLGYMKTIRFAAKKWKGFGWRYYDEKFRQLVEVDPSKPWDKIDSNLWLLYVTAPFQERYASFPKGGASNTRPSLPAPGGEKTGMPCQYFNRTGRCKYADKCRFPHVCKKCGAPHSATKCGK